MKSFWLVWEAALDAKFGLVNLCFVEKDRPCIGKINDTMHLNLDFKISIHGLIIMYCTCKSTC